MVVQISEDLEAELNGMNIKEYSASTTSLFCRARKSAGRAFCGSHIDNN